MLDYPYLMSLLLDSSLNLLVTPKYSAMSFEFVIKLAAKYFHLAATPHLGE